MTLKKYPTLSLKNHPLIGLLGYFLIPLALLVYQSISLSPFPNTDNKLAFYNISKGGFMGGYSESGAVVQEQAVPVRIDSEGPVHLHTQGTLSLPELEIVSTGSGDQGVIDLSARGDIYFPPAKVRVEDVPTLSARKGLIYKTSGYHEEAIASTLHGTRVTIHSHNGRITGVRPQVVSLNTNRIVTGRFL